MLKKEIRDALNRLLECALIVAVIPLGWLVMTIFFNADWSFATAMKIAFTTMALFYSFYAGLTIFMSEKKDHAFEYLFSLPLSRGRILAYKILPRLLILTGIHLIASGLIGSVIVRPGHMGTFIGLGIYVWAIFFLSVSLSFVVDSFIAGFFGVLILVTLFNQLFLDIPLLIAKLLPEGFVHSHFLIGFIVSVLLLFLPMGAVFWSVFRRLDVKPMRFQRTPFSIVILSMLLLNLALFYVYHSVVFNFGSSRQNKTEIRKKESGKPITNGFNYPQSALPGSPTTEAPRAYAVESRAGD